MAFLRHGSILHKHKTALVQHLLHLQATITYHTYHSIILENHYAHTITL